MLLGVVDDRHIEHILVVLREELLHRLCRLATLDNHLIDHIALGKHLQNLVVVVDTLVDVDQNSTLANIESFRQGRHLVASYNLMTCTEIACADVVEGQLANLALAIGGAVDSLVVANHNLAVGCAMNIQLHDIHTHSDCRLDTLQRVLGEVSPIGTMRNDKNIVRLRVAQLTQEFVGTTLCHSNYCHSCESDC